MKLFLLFSIYATLLASVVFTIRVFRMSGEGVTFFKYIKYFFLTLTAYLFFHSVNLTNVEVHMIIPVPLVAASIFLAKIDIVLSSFCAGLIAFSLLFPAKLRTVEKGMAISFVPLLILIAWDFPRYMASHWKMDAVMILLTVILTLSYLAAIFAFYYAAAKTKAGRTKLIHFGTAFLLMIIGGPLHSFKGDVISAIANIIELFGVLLLAAPLVLWFRNEVVEAGEPSASKH